MDNNRKLIDPMEFYRYDRISDDVMFLGDGTSLRFTVSLSKDRKGNRDYYYHEYEYPSKFSGNDTLISIKRSFDYYLSFENGGKADGSADRAFIRIGLGQFLLIQSVLERVVAWFQDKKWEKLFVTYHGNLTITSNMPTERVDNLPGSKYIEFVPTIIDRGIAKADKEPGVRMYLSDQDNYVDLTVDKLFGLLYIFKSFNMYQSSQEMLNYIGRPPFGTERVQLGEARGRRVFREEIEREPTGIGGRHVIHMANKSNIAVLE